MIIGHDSHWRTPTLEHAAIPDGVIALQHPAELLRTLRGQPTPRHDPTPELLRVLAALTVEERAELMRWCEQRVEREPRTCPDCRRTYPAALEECPWCNAGNEEF